MMSLINHRQQLNGSDKVRRPPTRITISFDEKMNALFEKLKAETKLSQSELVRQALKFYSENKKVANEYGSKRIKTYFDMLAKGEHIILDVDHFLLFLKLVESSPEKERFWKNHQKVARSHAEQLPSKVQSAEELLERLEACNFFTLGKISEDEFILILNSDVTKNFVKIFLEEVLVGMGYETEIKEDFAKLRVKVFR